MHFLRTETLDLPPRDFPLLLRAEWRTNHPRFGRLRALAAVAAMQDRTPRPQPYFERISELCPQQPVAEAV